MFQVPKEVTGSRPCLAPGTVVYSRSGVGAGKVGCFFKCISGGRKRDSHPWGGGQGSHSRKLFLSVPWAYFTERSPRPWGSLGAESGAVSCVLLSRCL